MRVDKIFDEYHVPYYTAGAPNTSPGWISIRCPFCNDHSNHLGVHLETGKVHCWKCKGHSPVTLLMTVLGVSEKMAKKLINKHQVRGKSKKMKR